MLLPSTGATPALVRKVPVVVFTNVSDDVLPSLKPVRSPKVTAPVIANRPPFVIVPAPWISMFPALHVTVPLLVNKTPAPTALAPPLMARLAPLEIFKPPAKVPPLQVPLWLALSASSPVPLPPSAPDDKLSASVLAAVLLKLIVPPLMVTLASASPPPLKVINPLLADKPARLSGAVRL